MQEWIDPYRWGLLCNSWPIRVGKHKEDEEGLIKLIAEHLLDITATLSWACKSWLATHSSVHQHGCPGSRASRHTSNSDAPATHPRTPQTSLWSTNNTPTYVHCPLHTTCFELFQYESKQLILFLYFHGSYIPCKNKAINIQHLASNPGDDTNDNVHWHSTYKHTRCQKLQNRLYLKDLFLVLKGLKKNVSFCFWSWRLHAADGKNRK